MRKVESISFPRSGHALTTKLLQAYFGPSFRYEAERPDGSAPDEFDFLKRHDFDLNTPILSDRWYLVQVRDVYDAMWSWQRLTSNLDNLPDTPELFRQIFRDKIGYWKGFMEKWVLSDIPNRVKIRYRDLVRKPEEALCRILSAFGETPDPERVKCAVSTIQIELRTMPEFYL